MINFSGFADFLEYSGSPTTRPDQQAFGHGKDGAMDSLSTQAMELDVPEKAFTSTPFVGSNYDLGKNKILGGLSSWTVVDIGPKTVTLELRDEGSKRFIKTPSGALYRDPSKQDTPRKITVSREYYAKMQDDQYGGGAGGGIAGAPPSAISGGM